MSNLEYADDLILGSFDDTYYNIFIDKYGSAEKLMSPWYNLKKKGSSNDYVPLNDTPLLDEDNDAVDITENIDNELSDDEEDATSFEDLSADADITGNMDNSVSDDEDISSSLAITENIDGADEDSDDDYTYEYNETSDDEEEYEYEYDSDSDSSLSDDE